MTCRPGRRCRSWLPDTGSPKPSAPWPSSAWPTTSHPGRAPPPIWPRRPARTPRALRALVALGLCGREATGRFRLTPLGEAMRSDVPDSVRAWVLFITAPWVERGWEKLSEAVCTGDPTFPRVHGVGFWDYLGAHPEDGVLFDAALSGGASARAEALRASRDLSSIGTVVDVGGGQGRLLAGLLEAVPGLRGVLFDRPEVVTGAEAVLRAAGVADRCTVVGGDFFSSAPG